MTELEGRSFGISLACCHMCDNARAFSIALTIAQLLSFYSTHPVRKESESVETNVLAGLGRV